MDHVSYIKIDMLIVIMILAEYDLVMNVKYIKTELYSLSIHQAKEGNLTLKLNSPSMGMTSGCPPCVL